MVSIFYSTTTYCSFANLVQHNFSWHRLSKQVRHNLLLVLLRI